MTEINLTCHYGRFRNVDNTFSIGDAEHEGNASSDIYALPEGYVLEDGVVRDPSGIECAIVADEFGKPLIRSMVGSYRDQRLEPLSAAPSSPML